ncbi:AEC family transporter [Burkholderia dolosa]|uniref:AEC family transporter n=1 Tax=Burkholderia dolosa TaxID=152500 RepID=UPI001C95E278|nr:hypothetical protein [Burkholderia dolosa]MBY4753486.1 hypothetical protein [Burkholderia dolosa]
MATCRRCGPDTASQRVSRCSPAKGSTPQPEPASIVWRRRGRHTRIFFVSNDIMALEFLLPFAFFFVGLYGRQWNVARDRAVRTLSWMISWIMLPAAVISSMSSLHLDRSVLLLPAANLFIVVGLLLVTGIGAALFKVQRRTAGAAVIACGSLEGGSIGLALTLFGSALLPEFFVFDVTHAFLLFTLTYMVACVFGRTGEHTGRFIRAFVLGPIPVAIVVGLLLNVAHVHIDPMIYATLGAVSYLILPAVMTILGFRFAFNVRYLKISIVLTFAKIVVGYVLGALFVHLFEPSARASSIILLSACLPPSFLTLVFAEDQRLDSEFLATFLPVSAIIAFAVLYAGFRMFPALL